MEFSPATHTPPREPLFVMFQHQQIKPSPQLTPIRRLLKCAVTGSRHCPTNQPNAIAAKTQISFATRIEALTTFRNASPQRLHRTTDANAPSPKSEDHNMTAMPEQRHANPLFAQTLRRDRCRPRTNGQRRKPPKAAFSAAHRSQNRPIQPVKAVKSSSAQIAVAGKPPSTAAPWRAVRA